MQDVACNLCGSSDRENLFSQQGRDPYLDIVNSFLQKITRYWCICRRCGFVYRSPVLEPAEIAVLYDGYEKPSSMVCKNPDLYFDRIVNLPVAESENAQKSDWFAEKINNFSPEFQKKSVSVLDVGCGGGTLLYTLKSRLSYLGKLFGVERNPAYADLANRRAGVDVKICEYKSGLFAKKFDLLINAKVLEHLPDPQFFLKQLAGDLADDGVLFIEVPDVSDIWSLSPSSDRFFIPHIYFFSANTLGEMLQRAGLSPIVSSVVATRGRNYLRMIAVKSKKFMSSTLPFDNYQDIVRWCRKKNG